MSESEPIRGLIVPPDKAREFVTQAGQGYLLDCVCRLRQKACPPELTNLCLHFEGAPEEDLKKGRPISTEKALSLLALAAEHRLMSQFFFKETSQQVTELCSCCGCCCTPVRNLVREGNYHEQLRSNYVAVTDADLCLDSCFFEARRLDDGGLRLVDERCFGCARCVERCPEGAIRLELQPGRGRDIPGLA